MLTLADRNNEFANFLGKNTDLRKMKTLALSLSELTDKSNDLQPLPRNNYGDETNDLKSKFWL